MPFGSYSVSSGEKNVSNPDFRATEPQHMIKGWTSELSHEVLTLATLQMLSMSICKAADLMVSKC